MCILHKEGRRKGYGKYLKSTVYLLEGGDGIFVKRGAEELTLRMCQGAIISALRYFCKDTTYCYVGLKESAPSLQRPNESL